MRNLVKRISTPVLQRFARRYFSKERKYKYKGVNIVVFPGVFFPHFTISTKLLMDFLEPHDLKGKSFLELGCGTGMISVFAAKKEAEVVASDINPEAILNAQKNAELNKVSLETLQSDLFKELQDRMFDYIIINPPYYPKNPTNDAEKAWFCGEDFQYFEQLFSSLTKYVAYEGQVFMILSEDCELQKIQEMAKRHDINFKKEFETRKQGELNFIFSLESI
jgi:release factor glutamine methyltransferase